MIRTERYADRIISFFMNVQLDWGPDNRTLVFGRLKMPEVLGAIDRTKLLTGSWCGDITFDLSAIDTAFSAQALPLVVLARDLRARGVDVDLVLPTHPDLRTLFLNTNWAHLIAPSRYSRTKRFSGHHVPATSYESSSDQQAVVTAVMDLLLEEVHIDRPVFGALEWCLNEITDNVLVHAGGAGGIVQVTRYGRVGHVTVCDAGRGIPSSMRAAFPDLTNDVDAVQNAMLPGVTSGLGQGNGLAGIESIARLAGGEINIITGQAFGLLCYTADERVVWDAVTAGITFPGTSVTLSVPLDVHFDLREALGFQNPDWEPFDFIEAQYEEQSGDFRVAVAEERRGVGSRDAGRALRTKTENLLSSDPNIEVTVDFTGIRMISSSFADEYIGKLRVRLGGETFNRRVKITGVSEAVTPVLSGAVSQRLRTGS